MNSQLLQAEVMIREAAALIADVSEKEADRSFEGMVSDLMATACVLELVNEVGL